MPQLAELTINPTTRRLLESVTKRMPHALLLMGEKGVGLGTIARALTGQKFTHLYEITPSDKGSISIDAIRELYRNTRTKQQLCVFIDDADTMTREAQNALLKLLEEPQESLHFILTSHVPQQLLPTILSRTQQVTCYPIASDLMDRLLANLGAQRNDVAQLRFMADGRPAEVTRLINDADYFKQRADIMKDAKTWLQGVAYDKLLIVQKYSNDRQKAVQLLEAVSSILRFSLVKAPKKQLALQLEAVQNSISKLNENRHTKLQLLYLT